MSNTPSLTITLSDKSTWMDSRQTTRLTYALDASSISVYHGDQAEITITVPRSPSDYDTEREIMTLHRLFGESVELSWPPTLRGVDPDIINRNPEHANGSWEALFRDGEVNIVSVKPC
jgi:hypothetical protein